jgi:hypothetical protein
VAKTKKENQEMLVRLRSVSAPRRLGADVLAAAALTLLSLAAASAATVERAASGLPVETVAAGDRTDKGLPPSPGPTNPNGP